MKTVKPYEPWFFIFFGFFHLHRVWGLVNRKAYSEFWIQAMVQKGAIYYVLMGLLAIPCIMGIATFIRYPHDRYWWRWMYLFGGGYVLFDLVMIATEQLFWRRLILQMFDITAPYWNALWLTFVILGAASLTLGVVLLLQYRKRRS